MSKIKIGITIGDINGIGPEVIIKALSNPNIYKHFCPVIYGSAGVISFYKNLLDLSNFRFQKANDAERLKLDQINVINCWEEKVEIKPGEAQAVAGTCAMQALDRATADLKAGLIDTLVTAPINKKTMHDAGFKYPGHTEYLTETFERQESLMLMVNDDLRVGTLSNHIPLKDAGRAVNKKQLLNKIYTLQDTLKQDFGITKPLIAVLGLNPHAGDSGLLGKEEQNIIRPAIIEAKKKGVLVAGPFAGDGFFGSPEFKKFDAILGMYHDQALIPFKTLSFGTGVNFTAGLPIIRTSPDHGTAYEIAGQNKADASSMKKALYTALDITRHRKEFTELHANALTPRKGLLIQNEVTEGE